MDQPVEVTAGGVRWLVSPQWRHRLLGPDGLRLDEWLRAGQAQVVKHGPHRTVYRVAVPGFDVHVKHCRLMNLRAWLREFFRPAKAWVEYRQTVAIAGRSIPTVEPLAVGRQQGGVGPSASFLITRSLEGVEPLSAFVETTLPTLTGQRQTRVRQRLAVELARFLARLHDCGIVHHDLHAGNLLIRHDAGDQIELFLIDLYGTKLGPPLSWRARRANLLILNRYFSMRAGRTDRLRFWRAYRTLSTSVGESEKESARALEQGTWLSNLRLWRGRDSRCLRINRSYQRIRSRTAAGHAVSDLDAAAIAMLLADPDAPFRLPGVKILKDSASSTVAELELAVGGVVRQVIYKRFRATSWTDPLTALLRPTPALRSWINGHGLRERDLPTARPLAVFHRRLFGLPHHGYLLMEKAPGVHLHGFIQELKCLPESERRRCLRLALDKVGGVIRELHRRRLSHRDLKAANVLVKIEDSRSFCMSVSMIDLVGLRGYRKLPEARKVLDLARLHVSFCSSRDLTRSDKLRFLRAYQQWGLFGKAGWKFWWRQIATATLAKLERSRRRGRPIG
jgi:tRNA A-37 threonylcarbamoyl transferase component Bud32